MIQYFRAHQKLPDDFQSFEFRRSNYTCSLSPEELAVQRKRFHTQASHDGRPAPRIAILLVEGFLLYYSAVVRTLLDIRLFIRIPRNTMHKRRKERANYILDNGEVWQDPPFYFDQIVWPAYLEAHAGMFECGDPEHGKAIAPQNDEAPDGGALQHLIVLEGESCTKPQLALAACNVIRPSLIR